MAQIFCGQENDVLNQLNERSIVGKTQTTETIGKGVKQLKTPMSKGLNSLKTSSDTSSRKAFGNVSNVLHSSLKPLLPNKPQMKVKSVAKVADELEAKPQEVMSEEVVTECTSESMFLDEIEDMFPNEEELISDDNDSITRGLFEIDVKDVLQMQFDCDFTQCLVKNQQNFDLNSFL